MATAPDTRTGTITLTSGSVNFTTTGVNLLTRGHLAGDTIFRNGLILVIDTIIDENLGTLVDPCPAGAAGTAVPVRIRFQPDGSRVKAESRNLIEKLGNGMLESFAALDGTGGNKIIKLSGSGVAEAITARSVIALAATEGVLNGIPMYSGPDGVVMVPRADFVSGVKYDVQVADLAARAAYNGRAEGFSVLVSNIGDGRAAFFSKLSATSGNWSQPAYLTGVPGVNFRGAYVAGTTYDINDSVTLNGSTFRKISTDAAGTSPSTATPPVNTTAWEVMASRGTTGATGVIWRGAYVAGTTYAINDVVTFNGSSFRKLTTAAAGNAPSNASPPVNTVDWEIIAAKGLNGIGTGDFIGPNSSTDNGVVGFDGLTGKLGKQLSPAQIRSASSTVAYEAQTLTQTQKSQASINIGQAWEQFGSETIINSAVSNITITGLNIFRRLRIRGFAIGSVEGSYLIYREGAGTGVDGSNSYFARQIYSSGTSNLITNQLNVGFHQIGQASATGGNKETNFELSVENFNTTVSSRIVSDCFNETPAGEQAWLRQGTLHNYSVSNNTIILSFNTGNINRAGIVIEGMR